MFCIKCLRCVYHSTTSSESEEPTLNILMWTLQEIAVSFSESGARGYNSGPAFVSEEICRTFHSASEKFLHLVWIP